MTSRPPMMPVVRRLLGAAGLILASGILIPQTLVAAAVEETGFVRRTFHDDDGDHGYVVYVPGDYTPDRAWPVMLFLHGAGERGSDGVRQSEAALGAMIRRWGGFPWIVVFPQAEDERGPIRTVWAPDAPDGRRALAILDEVERTYSIDTRHRVLSGWSMGGRGAYMLAAAFPERWSAVAPVAGWADLDLAEKLVDVPVWAFHGTADSLVSYDEDKALVESIAKQGGKPFFTTMPDRGHYIWRTVYASPVVFEWMSDPARFAERNEAPELNPIAEVELTRDETHGPFVPAIEVHDAVAVRLGPDLFQDLSDVATQELAAKPTTGVLPGTTTRSKQAGIVFTVQTSRMSYVVPVTDVRVTPTARGTLSIRVAVSNARLTIGRTDVRGLLCSATAGPMSVVLGHRASIPIEIEAVPYLCDEQFRLRTQSVRFSIPRGNWYVTRPAVARESLFLPPDRVADSLVEGVYANESRIERDVRKSVAEAIDAMRLELPPVSNDQLLTALWPVPAYRPRIKPRLEQIAVDENGLVAVFGMTVAAVDSFQRPPEVKTVDFDLGPGDVGQADLAISAAESLVEPLSAQLIEAGVAHVNVLDIPDRRYASFADREILGELIPAIRSLPADAAFRTEFYLREPLALKDTSLTCEPGECFSVFDLRVPNLTAVVSVRETATAAWTDYAEFQYDVTQPIRLQLGSEVVGGRQVISACNDSPEIQATGRWLTDPPEDSRLEIEAAVRLFHQSWSVWSDACKPTAIVIPDLEFRGYVRRLALLEPGPRGMSVGFEEPETVLTNESEIPLVYRTRHAGEPQGVLLTLLPGESRTFRVSRPLGYESATGGRHERYSIPPGRDATFKPLGDGRFGLVLESLPLPLGPPMRVPGT
ncbi:MAG: alpha/beta hydrolase-fold protein, partial [Planctomycetaceae bacterium]